MSSSPGLRGAAARSAPAGCASALNSQLSALSSQLGSQLSTLSSQLSALSSQLGSQLSALSSALSSQLSALALQLLPKVGERDFTDDDDDKFAAMAVVLCTAGYDHKVRFWEASSRACTRTIRYPESQVNCLAISNDKEYVAAGGNPNALIFNVATETAVVAQCSHASNVTGVGFQADRRWIFTGSDDGTVKVWDLRAPQRAQRRYQCTHRGTKAAVNGVVLHPNQGELISGDDAGTVRIWDLQADKCSVELNPRRDAADAANQSKFHEKKKRLPTTSRPNPLGDQQRLRNDTTPIRSVAIASDASRLICGDDAADVYSWRQFEHRSYELEHVIEAAHCDGSGRTFILKTAISPDAQLLVTTSSDKTAKLWRLPQPRFAEDDHSFDDDDEDSVLGYGHRLPSFSSDHPQQAETPGDFALERTLAQHQRWVWDACFSADSAYLVTASSDHSARLWDLHSGSAIRYYSGHTLAVTCCALNDSSA